MYIAVLNVAMDSQHCTVVHYSILNFKIIL